MSVPLSIRLPDDTAKALEELSESTDRPKSYYVLKALESFLREQADYMIAIERLKDKDDPVISISEMRKRLEIED